MRHFTNMAFSVVVAVVVSLTLAPVDAWARKKKPQNKARPEAVQPKAVPAPVEPAPAPAQPVPEPEKAPAPPPVTPVVAPEPVGPPGVAVLALEAKSGVPKDVAELITEHSVDALRRSARFSRVVSAAEVRESVGFEQTKQLMQCDSGSCLAEIAGALGTEFIFTGSVGKVGDLYVFQARLINVRTGVADASVSRMLQGGEADLLRNVDSVVAQLLRMPAIPAGTALGSTPAADPAAVVPGAIGTAPRRGSVPLRVVGAVAAAAGVPILMGGVVLAILAVAAVTVPYFLFYVPTPMVPGAYRKLFFPATAGLAGTVGALAVVAALAAGGGGVAALVASFVVGGQ